MKVRKNGTLKLSKCDKRVGNFVLSVENGHYKLQDIGGLFSVRVSTALIAGRMIQECMGDAESSNFLHNYAAVMYNVACCVPDIEFLGELQKAVTECVNRHKDLYGLKEDISDEEDAKILREEVELAEAEEEVRKEEGLE